MRAKLDGFAGEMKQLATDFPKKPFESDLPEPLDPVPGYHAFDPSSNTAVIMLDQMQDAMHLWKAKDSEFDLHASVGMIETFNDRYSAEEAEEGWREKLEAYLDVRYIVAVRTLKYVAPKISSEKSISGGTVVLMLALYDRQKKKWLFAAPVIALPYEKADLSQESNEITQVGMAAGNRKRIRKMVDEKLTKITGGSFEFDVDGSATNH